VSGPGRRREIGQDLAHHARELEAVAAAGRCVHDATVHADDEVLVGADRVHAGLRCPQLAVAAWQVPAQEVPYRRLVLTRRYPVDPVGVASVAGPEARDLEALFGEVGKSVAAPADLAVDDVHRQAREVRVVTLGLEPEERDAVHVEERRELRN